MNSIFYKKLKKIIKIKLTCSIPNLGYLIKQKCNFPHPIGIVIHKDCIIGKNCKIYQNTTIGEGRFSEKTKRKVPIIGNNVKIYPNCVIAGGITIGDNVTIGAGKIIFEDIEANTKIK